MLSCVQFFMVLFRKYRFALALVFVFNTCGLSRWDFHCKNRNYKLFRRFGFANDVFLACFFIWISSTYYCPLYKQDLHIFVAIFFLLLNPLGCDHFFVCFKCNNSNNNRWLRIWRFVANLNQICRFAYKQVK